jgi:hypothetical protein
MSSFFWVILLQFILNHPKLDVGYTAFNSGRGSPCFLSVRELEVGIDLNIVGEEVDADGLHMFQMA